MGGVESGGVKGPLQIEGLALINVYAGAAVDYQYLYVLGRRKGEISMTVCWKGVSWDFFFSHDSLSSKGPHLCKASTLLGAKNKCGEEHPQVKHLLEIAQSGQRSIL